MTSSHNSPCNRAHSPAQNRGRKQAKPAEACPHAARCGGCAYQGIAYKEQLDKKQEYEQKLLSSYGSVSRIIGMDKPYHYRNKVHAAFGRDRYNNIICGSYEESSHRIVDNTACLIEDTRAKAIIEVIRRRAGDFGLKIYDERNGTGLLRHVLIRTGHKSGQILVILVMASTFFPSKKNFIRELIRECPEITSVVININNRRTSMILGDRQYTEYGSGYIEDTLCGITYRISPKSFYQVNAVQTELLYTKAIELARLTGSETVIDAYSGIGTIGMTVAGHVRKVISVETNTDAVKDARRNAKANNISNIDIYADDAGRFMRRMADNNETCDVIFMDPPRAGSDKVFLNSILKLMPSKVIYISCCPETLARDLAVLARRAYRVAAIQPVDMFPWTSGIETIVCLERR